MLVDYLENQNLDEKEIIKKRNLDRKKHLLKVFSDQKMLYFLIALSAVIVTIFISLIAINHIANELLNIEIDNFILQSMRTTYLFIFLEIFLVIILGLSINIYKHAKNKDVTHLGKVINLFYKVIRVIYYMLIIGGIIIALSTLAVSHLIVGIIVVYFIPIVLYGLGIFFVREFSSYLKRISDELLIEDKLFLQERKQSFVILMWVVLVLLAYRFFAGFTAISLHAYGEYDTPIANEFLTRTNIYNQLMALTGAFSMYFLIRLIRKI